MAGATPEAAGGGLRAARRPIGAGGAPDWYAVLGLPDPRSGPGAVLTHDAIKKQHRKLCLLVHPDKNPSAAADGAFKLVQAAWDALSATHPPLTSTAASKPPQAPPTPPRPPDPRPQPQPRPRPQVVQMPQRAAAPAPGRTGAPRPQPQNGRRVSPPPAPRGPPSPPGGNKCPACGAHSTKYGTRNFRCMSCHWKPMDDCVYDDDDDFMGYDY